MATPKRLFAVAPMLLVVALLLLTSCHGRELKKIDHPTAAAGSGTGGGGGGVDESKTLLGLPVPLVPNLPLPLTPVTGPLIPGVPPAARASTDNNKKQSP